MPKFSELFLRIISALVLGPLVLAAVLLGGMLFHVLIGVAAIIGMWEWVRLAWRVSHHRALWLALGVPYVMGGTWALLWLRDTLDGQYSLLYLLLVIWATDIGAYVAGRLIGGPKLAPRISPKKTWAGLGGGVFCAGLLGELADWWTGFPWVQWPVMGEIAIVLAILAQMGDLFESAMKRQAGVKDSGRLIPGHGGLLDRVDGLLMAAPVFALFVWLALVFGFIGGR